MVPEFVRRFDFEMKEEGRLKLSSELQGVAVDGMLFGESPSPLKLSQCSSGTCSFDEVAGVTHSSAGFCSQCTDATAALRESVVAGSDATAYHFGDMAGFNLTWPPADGRLFNMLSGDSFASARAPPPRAFTSDHGRYARVGQEVNILAVNCTLSPCVRHLSATIINGSLEETLVFEQENTNWTFQWEGGKRTFGGYTTMIEPCVVNGTWYDRYNISEATRGDTNSWTSWGLAPDSVDSREALTECVRAIGADMMDGLQTFLSSTLAGACVVESGSAPDLGRGGFVPEGGQNKQQLHFSCGDKWLLDRLYDQGRVTFETVARAYDRVSLLLAAVILVAAYVQSCRERAGQPIWKSTVLPLLFYNVHTAAEGRESEAVTSALTMRELRALADKTQARFDADVGFVVRTSG
ncbi:hypothetical protein CPLU01_16087 [Colletotrichum plurivorum]|uniref:Uncharacterized protein n=1 Tax=Colletotrichum plurivorum TaxID=2175906 RepID=A0A8H6J0I9_9PEZI|nr:hypothetical protein CPLU01_16087 [Colletotrichum plurivorum]